MIYRMLTMVSIAWLMSCNNNDSTIETKTDSIGKKFDSVATRSWDSTKAKARELKDKVEGVLEKKDSTNKQ